jgi:hypothetical protein
MKKILSLLFAITIIFSGLAPAQTSASSDEMRITTITAGDSEILFDSQKTMNFDQTFDYQDESGTNTAVLNFNIENGAENNSALKSYLFLYSYATNTWHTQSPEVDRDSFSFSLSQASGFLSEGTNQYFVALANQNGYVDYHGFIFDYTPYSTSEEKEISKIDFCNVDSGESCQVIYQDNAELDITNLFNNRLALRLYIAVLNSDVYNYDNYSMTMEIKNKANDKTIKNNVSYDIDGRIIDSLDEEILGYGLNELEISIFDKNDNLIDTWNNIDLTIEDENSNTSETEEETQEEVEAEDTDAEEEDSKDTEQQEIEDSETSEAEEETQAKAEEEDVATEEEDSEQQEAENSEAEEETQEEAEAEDTDAEEEDSEDSEDTEQQETENSETSEAQEETQEEAEESEETQESQEEESSSEDENSEDIEQQETENSNTSEAEEETQAKAEEEDVATEEEDSEQQEAENSNTSEAEEETQEEEAEAEDTDAEEEDSEDSSSDEMRITTITASNSEISFDSQKTMNFDQTFDYQDESGTNTAVLNFNIENGAENNSESKSHLCLYSYTTNAWIQCSEVDRDSFSFSLSQASRSLSAGTNKYFAALVDKNGYIDYHGFSLNYITEKEISEIEFCDFANTNPCQTLTSEGNVTIIDGFGQTGVITLKIETSGIPFEDLAPNVMRADQVENETRIEILNSTNGLSYMYPLSYTSIIMSLEIDEDKHDSGILQYGKNDLQIALKEKDGTIVDEWSVNLIFEQEESEDTESEEGSTELEAEEDITTESEADTAEEAAEVEIDSEDSEQQKSENSETIEMTSIVPANNATDFSVEGNLEITFDQDIQLNSDATKEIRIKRHEDDSIIQRLNSEDCQTDNNKLIINLSLYLENNTKYFVEIDENFVEYHAGINDKETWLFTTNEVTERTFDIVVSHYIKLGDLTKEKQEIYEKIFGYFADSIYEATEGVHKIGKVSFYTDSQNKNNADISWQEEGYVVAYANGYGKQGLRISIADDYPVASTSDHKYHLEMPIRAGYTLGHEWSHYTYGLGEEYDASYDEYDDDPVKYSMMNRSNYAEDGDYRYLNYSIANDGSNGDHMNTGKTHQHRVNGMSCWETLSEYPDWATLSDRSLLRSAQKRSFWPELKEVAPAYGEAPQIQLPSADAKRELIFEWI